MEARTLGSRGSMRSASGTSTGVRVMATAYRRTSLSNSVKAGLVSKAARSRSCASVTPWLLPTAEPISIQKGQPISVAALMPARALRGAGTVVAAA